MSCCVTLVKQRSESRVVAKSGNAGRCCPDRIKSGRRSWSNQGGRSQAESGRSRASIDQGWGNIGRHRPNSVPESANLTPRSVEFWTQYHSTCPGLDHVTQFSKCVPNESAFGRVPTPMARFRSNLRHSGRRTNSYLAQRLLSKVHSINRRSTAWAIGQLR